MCVCGCGGGGGGGGGGGAVNMYMYMFSLINSFNFERQIGVNYILPAMEDQLKLNKHHFKPLF